MTRFTVIMFLICTAVVLTGGMLSLGTGIPAYACDARLTLSDPQVETTSSCQQNSPIRVAIAGSKYFLNLKCTADTVVQPLTPEWPEGYEIEAALDLEDNQPFKPTPGLIKRLQPVRKISMLNFSQDYQIRNNTGRRIDVRYLNMREFSLTIPANLAGHTLVFRAKYHNGDCNVVSNTTGRVAVVLPCDRDDEARVVASYIYDAYDTRDYHRAIALADSMLENDLSNPVAWYYAMVAAGGLQAPDKYLQYFDRDFQDYGTWGLDGDLSRDGAAQRKLANRELYEQRRAETVRRALERGQQVR